MSYYTPTTPAAPTTSRQNQNQNQQQQLNGEIPWHLVPRPPPESGTGSKVFKNTGIMLFSFGMGMVVGSSVVGLHFFMSARQMWKTDRQRVLKTMLSSGASFGTIFAIGSLFRPQH